MKRPQDKAAHIAAKIVMTLTFLWSGFFYSVIPVITYINNEELSHISYRLMTAFPFLLVGLILCWLRLYIPQFPFCAVGLVIFIGPVTELIDLASKKDVIFKPSFELRYMPIIAFGIISLVLFLTRLWQIISARVERRREYDNRPTESILEKRSDE